MRWTIFYLVLMVITMPAALADISLENFNTVDYNLGDKAIIAGSILMENDVYGRLDISLVCDEEVIPVHFSLIDLKMDDVYDFFEQIPMRENMLGDCYFWIKLNDDYNLILEKTSEKIHVKKELDIGVYIDSSNKYPGEVIEFNGYTKKSNGLKLKEGNVSIILDNKKYYSKVTDGELIYSLTTEDNTKSGKHEIVVIVNDGKGNEGKETLEVVVNAVPKELKIELNSKTLKPKDILSLKVFVYDQGGDLIKKGVNVDLLNSENELENSVNERSEDNIEFKLPEFALPGTWKVKVDSGELNGMEEFYVEEIIDKEIYLEGDILVIKNTGNVEYNDEIVVNLESEGKDYKITKKTSLMPNQIVRIDLTEDAPSGSYDVIIPGYPAITGNVVVEKGAGIGGNKWMGYVALVFVLVFLAFMVFNKEKGNVFRKKGNKRERAKLEGRKRLEELKNLPKKNKIVEKGPTKEDVDFLIKKVQKQEDKRDKDSNLFNMFD